MLVSFVLSKSKDKNDRLSQVKVWKSPEVKKKNRHFMRSLPWQTSLIISSLLNFCALNVSFVSFDNFFTSQVTCKFPIPLKVCVHSLWSCNSFKLSNDACLFNFISLLSLEMQAKKLIVVLINFGLRTFLSVYLFPWFILHLCLSPWAYFHLGSIMGSLFSVTTSLSFSLSLKRKKKCIQKEREIYKTHKYDEMTLNIKGLKIHQTAFFDPAD